MRQFLKSEQTKLLDLACDKINDVTMQNVTQFGQNVPRVDAGGDCELVLQNNALWKKFHEIGTEMIITKSGRRMFPSMRLEASGLNPAIPYCVVLEMALVSENRHKFTGRRWTPAGASEPQSSARLYLHPDSPAPGSHWMDQTIIFNKVKLTNNNLDRNGHIVLTSMHRYQPRIHIVETNDPRNISFSPSKTYTFLETSFMAVTAYQNEKITKLKIDNNPFAKGFRETGQSKCKRKRNVESEENPASTDDRLMRPKLEESVIEESDYESTLSATSRLDSPDSQLIQSTIEDSSPTNIDMILTPSSIYQPTKIQFSDYRSSYIHPYLTQPHLYQTQLYHPFYNSYTQGMYDATPLYYPLQAPNNIFSNNYHSLPKNNPNPEDLSCKSKLLAPKKDFSIRALIGA